MVPQRAERSSSSAHHRVSAWPEELGVPAHPPQLLPMPLAMSGLRNNCLLDTAVCAVPEYPQRTVHAPELGDGPRLSKSSLRGWPQSNREHRDHNGFAKLEHRRGGVIIRVDDVVYTRFWEFE